jgi:hypothetical protein
MRILNLACTDIVVGGNDVSDWQPFEMGVEVSFVPELYNLKAHMAVEQELYISTI